MTIPTSVTAMRVLATLERMPNSATSAVAAAAFTAPVYCLKLLRAFHAARLVYVSGWVRNGTRGPYAELWSAGDGDDVPRPALAVYDWRRQRSAQRVMTWLKTGNTGTSADIAAACAAGLSTVQIAINAMRKEKLVRVARYNRCIEGGSISPIYAWNPNKKPDAPRPPRMTTTQWRHRRKELLKCKFGEEAAEKISRAMFWPHAKNITVVVDGRPVYRRGEGMLVSLRRQPNEAAA